MYPFHFAPECEAMAIVASVARSPARRCDLGTAPKLSFAVTAREKGAAASQQVRPGSRPWQWSGVGDPTTAR
jgi:hypothetical protein